MPHIGSSRAQLEVRRGGEDLAGRDKGGETPLEQVVSPFLPAEVPMTQEEQDELIAFLDDELSQAESERQPYIDKLKRMQELYRTPLPTGEKNFPFKRASQITIPIAKMTVNVLAPRITDDLVKPDPPWSIRSGHENPVFERVAKINEDFMGLYARRRIRLERKIEDLILEGCKLGTAFWEIGLSDGRRQTAKYTDDGLAIELGFQGASRGPQVFNIPVEDFWWKFGFTDFQEMPWCGKMLHFTERQMNDRVISGKFRPEAVKESLERSSIALTRTTTQLKEDVEKFEKTEPRFGSLKLVDVSEIYIYWPIRVDDGEGKEVTVVTDLLVYYVRESRQLLRVQLNPWWHEKRPFLAWQYTPIEYRIVGEGIPEQVEQFQAEITSLHRLRLDNATLSSMRMIIVSKVVEGLRPGDPLYPGKVIKATNVADVQPFQLTDIYPSTILNENLSLSLIERIVGINEAILGQSLPVTRTTATANVLQSEEARQRFNLTIRRARRIVEEAGEMIYDLFHQFGTNGLASEWLGPQRGEIVETLFTFPRERVVQGITVHVRATGAKVNRQLEMQSNLQLFQLVLQLHKEILQITPPQALPMIFHALVSSAKKFMTRVLESFDEPDPEGTLQALTLLERIFPSPESQGQQTALAEQLEELQAQISGLEPQLRGAVGTGVAEQLGGLEGAVRALARVNGGRPGVGGGL